MQYAIAKPKQQLQQLLIKHYRRTARQQQAEYFRKLSAERVTREVRHTAISVEVKG